MLVTSSLPTRAQIDARSLSSPVVPIARFLRSTRNFPNTEGRFWFPFTLMPINICRRNCNTGGLETLIRYDNWQELCREATVRFLNQMFQTWRPARRSSALKICSALVRKADDIFDSSRTEADKSWPLSSLSDPLCLSEYFIGCCRRDR